MVSRTGNTSRYDGNRQLWSHAVRGAVRRLGTTMLLGGLASLTFPVMMPDSAEASVNRYCQLSESDVVAKEALRVASVQGDAAAEREYKTLSAQHAAEVKNCRRSQWPQNQAIWLRLYPSDLEPGQLDAVMDRVVNLGYNQVYIESFSNGQVLLPKNDNPTVWPSLVQAEQYADRDLLSEAIDAAHDRNLQAYAWMFTLNFGYSYGQRSDRRQVLARNGAGEDTLDLADQGNSGASEDAFVDPYNRTAQADYAQMVRAVIARDPDGALYDYVRYPRLTGAASVVSNVRNLWIYGPAANQALVQRGSNNKGKELIRRFLQRGYLTDGDVAQVDSLYPTEGEPLWQSRNPPATDPKDLAPASERRPGLQNELWRLSVAHAIQGVVDFLQAAATPTRQAGLPAGAVFFPFGNRAVGSGYDARLQHWNRFPSWMDSHPMAYAVCGNTDCIVDEVQQVLRVKRNAATVKPALAGRWGVTESNRPSLEAQMDALQRAAPQLKSVSHWSFSWQDAEFDRSRKFFQSRAQQPADLEAIRQGATSRISLPVEEITESASNVAP
ncbi:MAG: family 10 glycosylhydrolase [Cyanobacteria bacterium J06560_2]